MTSLLNVIRTWLAGSRDPATQRPDQPLHTLDSVPLVLVSCVKTYNGVRQSAGI